jgi:hypothetical protein
MRFHMLACLLSLCTALPAFADGEAEIRARAALALSSAATPDTVVLTHFEPTCHKKAGGAGDTPATDAATYAPPAYATLPPDAVTYNGTYYASANDGSVNADASGGRQRRTPIRNLLGRLFHRR